jgi:hypothetical protein
MRRKHDANKDELEGIAQRLRSERPVAGPLDLDRSKATAMSRANTASGRAGARRLAVAGLTVGLMAAGTGGVIAGASSGHSSGNAATAQYGNTATPAGGVLGSTTTKTGAKTGKIKVHVRIPRKGKVRKVTIKLNGKRYAVFSGKRASSTINLTNVPCGVQKLQITVTLTSGKTISQTHTYKLC